MSSRPQLDPYHLIVNGSMAASITSEPTIINKLSMISYDISWAGTTPIGTLSVQVSNTYSKDSAGVVKNAGNWTTISLAGGNPAVSGNTGNGGIDVDVTAFYAIRLVYTRSSGVGTLNVTIHGKVT